MSGGLLHHSDEAVGPSYAVGYYLLKGAAISAIERPGPLQDFYAARVEKGMRPSLARLTLARKIAAITLTMWKKGVSFDPKQLQRPTA